MFDYNKHIILLTLAGSRAYGLHNENSDYDYRGVIIPPSEAYNSPFKSFEQKEGLDGYGRDSVAYEIKKFFKLAAACNPNILDCLFVKAEHVVLADEKGLQLRENRHLFLSQKAKHSFSGYAMAQLKRLKSHKKWLDEQDDPFYQSAPTREAFGLPKKPLLSSDHILGLASLPAEFTNQNNRQYVLKEVEFRTAKKKFDDFSDWKKTRNLDRLKLEEAFNYDTKHAMHLVRLLSQCAELQETGTMHVERPDASFLKDIRNGKYSYAELMEIVEEKEALIEASSKRSLLPKEPDWEKLESLCIDLISG